MLIKFSKKFAKQRDKASNKVQVILDKKLRLFYKDEFDSILNNHSLAGKYQGYRSINITGDWRAIYREIGSGGQKVIFFDFLGTHSQLYR